MRTLALLAAILLLALQAQAQPLTEAAEEGLEQWQAQEEDQDEDTGISFAEAESSGAQYSGRQKGFTTCHCRKRGCHPRETRSGFCIYGRKERPYCCL